jgi:tetratricopeptide (TPR) repeat protein
MRRNLRRRAWPLATFAAATFLLALSLVAVVVPAAAWADRASDALEGRVAHQRGDIDAIHLYTRALAAGDLSLNNQAIAYDNRGLMYSRKRDYQRAFADFDAALRLKPDLADTYYNRATAPLPAMSVSPRPLATSVSDRIGSVFTSQGLCDHTSVRECGKKCTSERPML